VADGSVFRRCSCRDENKKPLGSATEAENGLRRVRDLLGIAEPGGSATLRMDLYTNVAEEEAVDAARKLAGAIPRRVLHPDCTLGLPSGSQETTKDRDEVDEVRPDTTKPQAEENQTWGGGCAPSGTRTPNPLVKSQLLCQLS
jgi:hypothetical protein